MREVGGIFGKAIGRFMHRACILLVTLLVLAALPQYGHAGSKRGARPATGLLKVSVPARAMGDVEFWIYVDGKLVGSAPSKKEAEQSDGNRTMMFGAHPGWMIVDAHTGDLLLNMSNERWNASRLNDYIHAPDPDAFHIFRTFEIPLRPGRHLVEVAFETSSRSGPSPSGDDFPFVITKKVDVTVEKGETAKLYPPVPDRWVRPGFVAIPARQADMGCEDRGETPPDRSELERWMKNYLQDPIVKALHAADASALVKSSGFVVLDLPEKLGGSREFDRRQVNHLAQAVDGRYTLASREEIASCRNRYPQYSRSYNAYDKALRGIDKDLESFYILAKGLKESPAVGK